MQSEILQEELNQYTKKLETFIEKVQKDNTSYLSDYEKLVEEFRGITQETAKAQGETVVYKSETKLYEESLEKIKAAVKEMANLTKDKMHGKDTEFNEMLTQFYESFLHDAQAKLEKEEDVLIQLESVCSQIDNYKNALISYIEEFEELKQSLEKGNIPASIKNLNKIEKELDTLEKTRIDFAELRVDIQSLKTKILNYQAVYLKNHIAELTELNLNAITFNEHDTPDALISIIKDNLPKLEKIDFSDNKNIWNEVQVTEQFRKETTEEVQRLRSELPEIRLEKWLELFKEVGDVNSNIEVNFENTELDEVFQYHNKNIPKLLTFQKFRSFVNNWKIDIKKIPEIPRAFNDKVKFFEVTGTDITENDRNIFERFTNLEYIDLSNSGISDIDTLEHILEEIKDNVTIKVSAENRENFELREQEFTKKEYNQFKEEKEQIQAEEQARKTADTAEEERIKQILKKGTERIDERRERIKNKAAEEERIKQILGRGTERIRNKKLEKELNQEQEEGDFNLSESLQGEAPEVDAGIRELAKNFIKSKVDTVQQQINKEEQERQAKEQARKTAKDFLSTIADKAVATVSKKSPNLQEDVVQQKNEDKLWIMPLSKLQDQTKSLVVKPNVNFAKIQLENLKQYLQTNQNAFDINEIYIAPELIFDNQIVKQGPQDIIPKIYNQVLQMKEDSQIIIPFGQENQIKGAFVINKNEQNQITIYCVCDFKLPIKSQIEKGIKEIMLSNPEMQAQVIYININALKENQSLQQNQQYPTILAPVQQFILDVQNQPAKVAELQLQDPIKQTVDAGVQKSELSDVYTQATFEVQGGSQQILKEPIPHSAPKVLKADASTQTSGTVDTSTQTSRTADVYTQTDSVNPHPQETTKYSHQDSVESVETVQQRQKDYISSQQDAVQQPAVIGDGAIYQRIARERAKQYKSSRGESSEEQYFNEVIKSKIGEVANEYRLERESILESVHEEIKKGSIMPKITQHGTVKEYDLGKGIVLTEKTQSDGKVIFNIEEIMHKGGSCSISVPRLSSKGDVLGHDVIEVKNGKLVTFVLGKEGSSKIKDEQIAELLQEIENAKSISSTQDSIKENPLKSEHAKALIEKGVNNKDLKSLLKYNNHVPPYADKEDYNKSMDNVVQHLKKECQSSEEFSKYATHLLDFLYLKDTFTSKGLTLSQNDKENAKIIFKNAYNSNPNRDIGKIAAVDAKEFVEQIKSAATTKGRNFP